MPPKAKSASSQPKPKSHLDDPPPAAFYEAWERYFEAKAVFDAEKVKHWQDIPEAPPNTLPKPELRQPWFDRVMEEQQAMFLPKDENGKPDWNFEEKMQKLKLEEEEVKKKQGQEAKAKEQSEDKKEKEKERKRELIVDEDKFVRKLLGKGELIVPAGVYQPKKKPS